MDLFETAEPAVDAEFRGARRITLDATSWIEHVPGWLQGSAALFDELTASAPWEQRYRSMYGERVTEPRLTAEYRDLDDAPQEMLPTIVAALTRHYGSPTGTCGSTCTGRTGTPPAGTATRSARPSRPARSRCSASAPPAAS